MAIGTAPQEKGHIAESIDDLKKLRKYLCDLAAPARGPVKIKVCRDCESQCAYGKRYMELYQAQKDEKEDAEAEQRESQSAELEAEKRRREEAERVAREMVQKCMEMEQACKDAEKKAGDAILRAAESERVAAGMLEKCRRAAEVEQIVEDLRGRIKELEKRAEDEMHKRAEAQAETERCRMRLIKFKARLYDMEHPDDDD